VCTGVGCQNIYMVCMRVGNRCVCVQGVSTHMVGVFVCRMSAHIWWVCLCAERQNTRICVGYQNTHMCVGYQNTRMIACREEHMGPSDTLCNRLRDSPEDSYIEYRRPFDTLHICLRVRENSGLSSRE